VSDGPIGRGATMAALSPRERACVILRYCVDRTTAEIAAALGINDDAVKKHLGTAVRRLSGVLGPLPGRQIAPITRHRALAADTRPRDDHDRRGRGLERDGRQVRPRPPLHSSAHLISKSVGAGMSLSPSRSFGGQPLHDVRGVEQR
jgi:DNA-binding CsgD family transcriptional regulator